MAVNISLAVRLSPGCRAPREALFDEARPDVVHQNGQVFDLTFVKTWVAWRQRVPRVMTVHTR